MEFHFDVNQVLPEDITVVDSTLHSFKAHHIREKGADALKKHLEQVIDKMGVASSKAQSLKTTITSFGKLSASDHRLYLLKDSTANEGRGAVIGLIKVGKKKLFVVDIYSQQLEVNPLCVLDFYVHEKHQRSGYGHQLFNFMLQREGVNPQFLAYDRPSSKFINFLRKHYNLQNAIHQMNKFVVFDLFFRDLSAVGYVPRNKRFVSSAPSDSRTPSTSDARLISSAKAIGRTGFGALKDLQISDVSSTEYSTTLPSKDLSRLPSLPPLAPDRRKPSYKKETTWNRRNASHIQFSSSRETATAIHSPDHRKNLYSRHSYSPISKVQRCSPNQLDSATLHGRSDAALGVYGTKGQMKKQITPVSIKSGNEKMRIDIAPSGSEKTTQLHTTSENSYSVNKLYRNAAYTHNVSHGTSWNLFGVPANLNSPNRGSSRNKNNQTGLFY